MGYSMMAAKEVPALVARLASDLALPRVVQKKRNPLFPLALRKELPVSAARYTPARRRLEGILPLRRSHANGRPLVRRRLRRLALAWLSAGNLLRLRCR